MPLIAILAEQRGSIWQRVDGTAASLVATVKASAG
jgi:hypothetical protein